MAKQSPSKLQPDRLIDLTVWSSPQGNGRLETREACYNCAWWTRKYPDAKYDPAVQSTWNELIDGYCQNLRIMAAYGQARYSCSFYCCNYWKEKEKGNETNQSNTV